MLGVLRGRLSAAGATQHSCACLPAVWLPTLARCTRELCMGRGALGPPPAPISLYEPHAVAARACQPAPAAPAGLAAQHAALQRVAEPARRSGWGAAWRPAPSAAAPARLESAGLRWCRSEAPALRACVSWAGASAALGGHCFAAQVRGRASALCGVASPQGRGGAQAGAAAGWRGFAAQAGDQARASGGARAGAAGLSARRGAGAAQRRSADQGLYLVALVVGMVGVTYASVPLYRMFCQATGFGGTVQQGRTVEAKLRERDARRDEALEAAAAAREVTVTFNADVSDGMNWRFLPTQRAVKVRPGQSTLVFYTAHNLSERAVTGVSTYNVAPQQAGLYFNKIQCFCFEEQKLRPGEKVDMPVFFYIDPEFATDPRLRGIDHLTLSYTFFKVSEEDEQEDKVPVAAEEALPAASSAPALAHAAGSP